MDFSNRQQMLDVALPEPVYLLQFADGPSAVALVVNLDGAKDGRVEADVHQKDPSNWLELMASRVSHVFPLYPSGVEIQVVPSLPEAQAIFRMHQRVRPGR